MMRLILVVAIVACGLNAQQRDNVASRPAAGTASIAGIAIDVTDMNKPMRRVIVTLSGPTTAPMTSITDDAGRFAFQYLPAGRFYISAEKTGYIRFFFDSLRPGFPPARAISLGTGEARAVSLNMMRGAVIAGTIRDQSGGPLVGAQVRIYRRVAWDETVRLIEATNGPYQTDERGTYRFYGLPAADYVVAAIGGGPGNTSGDLTMVPEGLEAVFRNLGADPTSSQLFDSGRLNSIAITRGVSYYPGVIDMTDAQPITVAAGDVRSDVDIVNPLLHPAKVRGIVQSDVAASSRIELGIVNLSRSILSTSLGGVSVAPDGQFTIPGLTPGRWRLFSRTSAAGRRLFGQAELAIDGQDLTNVVIRLRPGANVAGKALLAGDGQRNLEGIRLKLDDLTRVAGEEASLAGVQSDKSGQFSFSNVPPGNYRLNVEPTAGLYLEEIVVNGAPTADTIRVEDAQDLEGVEVRLTDKPTDLTGRLISSVAVGDFSVVLFPVDPGLRNNAARRFGPLRLEADGSFRVRGLPAGAYYLAIVGLVEPSFLAEPRTLQALVESSLQVILEAGKQTKQDLTIK